MSTPSESAATPTESTATFNESTTTATPMQPIPIIMEVTPAPTTNRIPIENEPRYVGGFSAEQEAAILAMVRELIEAQGNPQSGRM